MNLPRKEVVEEVRRKFPIGCRVVLDRMDDEDAPPIGTQGTVTGVDDICSIHCAWDNGSSLGIAAGADLCHKISTEDEARVTLNWYGQHQREEDSRCPRCGNMMWGSKYRQALSRNVEAMVCGQCGREEALESAGFIPAKPLMEWCACVIPQAGGGVWRR